MTPIQSPVNRPGGFMITDRAFGFCSFKAGSKILDIGCGSGATVKHLKNCYNLDSYGLDIISDFIDTSSGLIRATAEEIPFPAASFDGALLECSLSVMDNQAAVLKECDRILKSDGRLIISDMYARGEPVRLQGCLKHLHTKEYLISLLEECGFSVELFEDHTYHLQTMWGQLIIEQGAKAFYCSVGADPATMKRVKCGYFLIVARKRRNP
ncbi:MAG: class I SAM-dependent methyltransferase [Bacteroidales bacterium]|nr:class I SAM-dependent methyltransferase [Bacteroidales bacterium]